MIENRKDHLQLETTNRKTKRYFFYFLNRCGYPSDNKANTNKNNNGILSLNLNN